VTKITFRDSVLCATRGLFKGISSERNIKIQLFFATFIIFVSLLLNISKVYLITIIIVCFLVLILELFNRGFEKLVDLISPDYNKEFGRVKDIMAGVVLLTSLMAIIVSLLILYEPMIKLLSALSKNLSSVILIFSDIFLISIILLAVYVKNKN
jgi:diacylglycerol kinase (ATP)